MKILASSIISVVMTMGVLLIPACKSEQPEVKEKTVKQESVQQEPNAPGTGPGSASAQAQTADTSEGLSPAAASDDFGSSGKPGTGRIDVSPATSISDDAKVPDLVLISAPGQSAAPSSAGPLALLVCRLDNGWTSDCDAEALEMAEIEPITGPTAEVCELLKRPHQLSAFPEESTVFLDKLPADTTLPVMDGPLLSAHPPSAPPASTADSLVLDIERAWSVVSTSAPRTDGKGEAHHLFLIQGHRALPIYSATTPPDIIGAVPADSRSWILVTRVGDELRTDVLGLGARVKRLRTDRCP